jgi:uncharacterized protein YjbI with pentapeptide repeats
MTKDELSEILANHKLWVESVGVSGAHANLARANLTGADLDRANLAGANLDRANLADADLAHTNLTRADLTGADLDRANLADANLDRANLAGANLTRAYLARAIGLPDAPTVPDLDRKILEASEDGARLEMGSWHCGTTHCRAGWAIALAGAEGAELEKTLGPSAAGALIYFRSTGRVPDFFVSTADALNDIRKCAGGAS